MVLWAEVGTQLIEAVAMVLAAAWLVMDELVLDACVQLLPKQLEAWLELAPGVSACDNTR